MKVKILGLLNQTYAKSWIRVSEKTLEPVEKVGVELIATTNRA